MMRSRIFDRIFSSERGEHDKATKAFHVLYMILMCDVLAAAAYNMFLGFYSIGLTGMLLLYILYRIRSEAKFSDRPGKDGRRRIKNLDNRTIWAIAKGISIAFMLVTAFGLRVNYSWDWGVVIQSAAFYVESGDVLFDPVYFARYPNNCFFLYLLIGLFKAVKFFYHAAGMQTFTNVSIVVNCLLIQLSITYLYKTSKLLWGEKKALRVGIISLLCIPFYLYSQFLYTDTLGMLLGAMLLFYYFKLKNETVRNSKILYAVVLGIIAAVGFNVKVTVLIVWIAILAEMIWSNRDWKRLGLAAIMMLCLLVANILIQGLVQTEFSLSDELKDTYEFPLTHWVMMGLRGNGGYSQEDVDFTVSAGSYREKRQANIEMIKARLNEMGASNLIKHIFFVKMRYTWGDSCLYGDNKVSRFPENEDGVFQKIFTYDGEWYKYCMQYTWAYHFIMILGVFLSGWYAMRKDGSQDLLVGRIAIVGYILFLSVWECRSRYLLTCLPILILVSWDGFFRFFENSADVRKK